MECTPSTLPPQPQIYEENMAIQELWLTMEEEEEANIVAELRLGPQGIFITFQ